ncbi:uncharacterized protein LOC143593318 [Bidens hawaiensis]|uniref:uncharacterized protein LOC143593318 n=1 Tax=Bidens hawaiensis TaxID=980011 RepID=UPI004049A68D
MTEKLHEELDDAKAEIEKLKSENLVKANLCENLKKSNNDQLKRIQELNLKLEKQAHEVEAKVDEVYVAKQSLEDLECKLKEKEKIILSFTSANDKLRADFNSKLRECEDEKQMLVSSLEEANAKILNLEDQNRALMDKIELLKEGIVSVSQKKCASESKMAKASKQMRERGDLFEKLEEEKMKLEEQLKWKNEQFKHLEEAHEKLKNNLRVKKNEWDIEKSTFYNDISTLETKLDSQITLSEDLKTRLELCKRALVQEEDRRKCLEIQISESNSSFLDTKSKLESMLVEKDSKIQETKEKNQELVLNLKKLKESQIQEAGNNSSIIKLQNKIKTLEENNNVKEAEWTTRFEQMVAELNCCRHELESKETRINEINNVKEAEWTARFEQMAADLNCCRYELESKDTRFNVINNIKEAEWTARFEQMVADLNRCRRELESKETCLKEIKILDDNKIVKEAERTAQFEQMVADLNCCKDELESKETRLNEYNTLVLQLIMEKEECEVMMVALKSILLETRSKIDEEKLLLHKQIDSYKHQLVQTKTELMNVNEELDRSYCETSKVEFELQIWKSVAEKLELDLEVNHRMRRELEASLLAQVETEVNLKEELKQKETRINGLEEDIKQLESERIHEYEKQNLDQQQVISSLEQEFNDSTASFSSQLAKMQAEMNMFHESWDKMITTMVIKEIEVQEKGLMIKELEKDLETRVRFVKKCMSRVKKLSLENEKLMSIIDGASEWINKLSREDGQVMGALRSIMSGFDDNRGGGNGCSELTDRFDPVKENKNNVYQSSPKRNMVENSVDERSPLRTMNGK